MSKKFFMFCAMVLLMGFSFDASAGKVDLQLRMLMNETPAAKAMLSKSITVRNNVEQIDVIIKSSDTQLTKVAIEEAGGMVRSIIDSIMTAFVPIDFLFRARKFQRSRSG